METEEGELTQEEVIARLTGGADRVECAAQFRQWKNARQGYVTRDPSRPGETATYRFTFVNAKGKSEWRQVFFPGFNQCQLYRV